MVLVATIALWAPAGSPVMAVDLPSTVFIDHQVGISGSVLQTFTPADSSINVQWDSHQLLIESESSTMSVTQRVYIAPQPGDDLTPGTYTGHANLDINGSDGTDCAESVTINSIDPVPEWGVPTASFTELSASFSHTCTTDTYRGEIRWHSADAIAAIGVDATPWPTLALTMATPGAFVGRTSPSTTIVLRNRGTTSLTIGAASLLGPAIQRWAVSADTCASSTLAVDATCHLTAASTEWVPGDYLDDLLTMPVSIGRGSVIIDLATKAVAATFVPIDPVRLVDTRIGLGLSSILATKHGRTFPVVDQAVGDPAHNIPPEAVAVVGNLTITTQSSAGYAALTDVASDAPTTSTLNVPKGDTRANGTIVRLSPDGTAGLTWVGSTGSTAHAIFDATGYFVSSDLAGSAGSGNFMIHAPTRVLDSRVGTGFSGKLVPNVPKTFTVPLEGVESFATAVSGNLTVVGATGGGFLTISPAAQTHPTTSTVNFPKGDTRANNAVVKLSDAKTLSVTYSGPSGTTVDVLFDLTGLFGAGEDGFVPLIPNRIVDSRVPQGLSGPLPEGRVRYSTVQNRRPTDPSRNVPLDATFFKSAVVGNATIVHPTKGGYLSVMPEGQATPPTTSTINAPKGDVRANGVFVGGGGVTPIRLMWWYAASSVSATTDVLFDVSGYFVHP
jgi:hypothetical protein